MTSSALWTDNGQEHLLVSGNAEDTVKVIAVTPNHLQLTVSDNYTPPTTVRVRRRLLEQLVPHLQAWLDTESLFVQGEE